MDRTTESLKRRCNSVESEIQSLPTAKITQSCKDRLLKLAQAELNFLSRTSPSSCPISTNIGYVESVVKIIQQPSVSGVSCVCKTIQVPLKDKFFNADNRATHVDIVCTYNRKPTWFVVSDRNPKYVSWTDTCNKKGLKTRLCFLLEAALGSVILQPVSVIVCFANGIDESIAQRLTEDFRAVEILDFKQTVVEEENSTDEHLGMQGYHSQSNIFQIVECGEWINILGMEDLCTEDSNNIHEPGPNSSSQRKQGWIAFEIKVSQEESLGSKYIHCLTERVNMGNRNWPEKIYTKEDKHNDHLNENILQLDKNFYSLVASMDLSSDRLVREDIIDLKENLINLDTTAMVALVSELSNGCAKKLVEMSPDALNMRFKSTSSFMREQANSEIEHPILDDMTSVLAGKRAMISEYVHNEFKDLISMCSGPNEKRRAECLLNCVLVFPNNPSVRVMGLPETGKIKLKHKLIFGTGDQWHAPTLTANMGFVRAILQTGMSLLVIEHRPRALVGS